MAGYLRPVPYTGISSWYAHTRRRPPSTEAGVDYYCPIGTPVLAPADGRVSFTGDSIVPASGRYVTVDFDDGRRFRALHLSRRTVSAGQRVTRGQVIGYSGASGYGEEDWSWNPATGGAHVHVTLWPSHRYTFGVNAGTLDFEQYASATPAGGGAIPFEEDDMTPQEHDWLKLLVDRIAGEGGISNAINDPNIGITATSAAARDHAANAANIASDVRNLITDPTIGVLAAIRRVTAGEVDVDLDDIAAKIRAGLGAEVAAELAKRLSA